MKLSKIEIKYEENDYGFPLYDAEQMQEYAKAKVKELLFDQLWNNILYANSKIFFDKEVEKICSTIFEEDTKND